MSMLVYYCNKNKRVVLSVILVFLCGINYICGEKKADQEGKATKQISATKFIPVQPLLTPALTPKANPNLSLTLTLGENHYNSRNP